tara:strand:- start:352 stop:705 length:354 start_codon:yes stop_codon:yes gene_type:complete
MMAIKITLDQLSDQLDEDRKFARNCGYWADGVSTTMGKHGCMACSGFVLKSQILIHHRLTGLKRRLKLKRGGRGRLAGYDMARVNVFLLTRYCLIFSCGYLEASAELTDDIACRTVA